MFVPNAHTEASIHFKGHLAINLINHDQVHKDKYVHDQDSIS